MKNYSILIGIAILLGCSAQDESKLDTKTNAVQVTDDLTFFCDWNNVTELFQTTQADYAQGNRRSAAAWTVVNSKSQPGVEPKKQGVCWHGALFYLGVFGDRTELPKLMQLMTKDPILDTEVTNSEQLSGISELGMFRAVAFEYAGYQAVAAQIRRQLVFDGQLDAHALAGQAMIQSCAQEHAQCMGSVAIYPFHRNRLQRSAVLGLTISGTNADLVVFDEVKNNIKSYPSMIHRAIWNAEIIKGQIDDALDVLKVSVPAP